MMVINFIRKYAMSLTAIIALIALFRPDIAKLLFPAEINIYKIGNIELTCNQFGSIIWLRGSIIALNYDQIIKNIMLKITRADGESHLFDCDYFITGKECASTVVDETKRTKEETFEFPYPFQITTTKPVNYYIKFYNTNSTKALKDDYNKLLVSWEKFKVNNKKANKDNFKNIINDFNKLDKFMEYKKALEKHFFWKEGAYKIQILVETSYGKIFSEIYSFEITKEQSNRILINHIPNNLEVGILNKPQLNVIPLSYK